MRAFFTSTHDHGSSALIRWGQKQFWRKSERHRARHGVPLLPEWPGAECEGRAWTLQHCGLQIDDADGQWYWESHWKKHNGKSGVRGPCPVAKLFAWIGMNPQEGQDDYENQAEGKRLVFLDIPHYPAHSERARHDCYQEARDYEYGKVQVFRNIGFVLFGRGVGIKSISRDRRTCCEFVAHRVPAWVWREGLLLGEMIVADQTTPMWLYFGLKRALWLQETHMRALTGETIGVPS